MAKTGFLILAHHQPAQLERLIERLDHPSATFVVHVDRKSDVAPFRRRLDGRVTFVSDPHRVDVQWCGFSTTGSILSTLNYALEAHPELERIVLLSGVDYPLKPVEEIIQALDPEREHIAVDRKLNPEGDAWLDTYISRVFLGDTRALNPRTARPWVSRLTRALEARLRRRNRYPNPIYHGAGWWALTRPAVDHVLQVQKEHPELINWFRYARVADEMVFQTLLMNSPRRAFIAYPLDGEARRPPHLSGVHYVDWTRANPDLPRVLDLSDLERMRASGALFARKMDPARSAALMDALDEASRT